MGCPWLRFRIIWQRENKNLFQSFGYEIYPTSPDGSYGNGPVERAHRTISQGIKTLLVGAGLDVRFWPYTYMHVLRICNALPCQKHNASPLFLATGKKDNFRNLRVFGCRVWVRPTGIQKKHFKYDVWKGIFLGYVPHTDFHFHVSRCKLLNKVGDS